MPPFLLWTEISDPSKAGSLCLADAPKSAGEHYPGSEATSPLADRSSTVVRQPTTPSPLPLATTPAPAVMAVATPAPDGALPAGLPLPTPKPHGVRKLARAKSRAKHRPAPVIADWKTAIWRQ